MKKTLLSTFIMAAGISISALAQEPVDAAMNAKIRKEGMNHSKAMDIAFHHYDVSGHAYRARLV